jgi:deoxyhypusine synthase
MAVNLLLNMSGGPSERLAPQLVWNRTVNINGGRGRNVSKDFYNEVINKKYKENSKVSSGQLTDETNKRHSQLLGIEEDFMQFYNENVVETLYKKVRKRGESTSKNELKHLYEMLIAEDVFSKKLRKCPGFDNIAHTTACKKPHLMKKKLIDLLDRYILEKTYLS